jgi:hypothetical protein
MAARRRSLGTGLIGRTDIGRSSRPPGSWRCTSAVIHGEVVVLDGAGRSDFGAVKTAI